MTQINGSRSIMIMDKDVETCAQQGMSLKRTRKSMIIQRLVWLKMEKRKLDDTDKWLKINHDHGQGC